MKKYILILLSFVLILALLPASPAHADYTCSQCGKTFSDVSAWKSNGDGTHSGKCPECGAKVPDCTESCSGGVASMITSPGKTMKPSPACTSDAQYVMIFTGNTTLQPGT